MDRRDALVLIGAILSDLVYYRSPLVFDAEILIDLGLMMRYSYTRIYTKFAVFTKASPEELQRHVASSKERRRLPGLVMEIGYVPGPVYSEEFRERVKGLKKFVKDSDIFVAFGSTQRRSLEVIKREFNSFKFRYAETKEGEQISSRAYNNKIKKKLEHILNIYAEKKHCIFVGHSLGGALAMAAAMDPAFSSRARDTSSIDTQEYYDTLGVKKGATPAEIKKAFRKLTMKKHPDRGGDEKEFKQIQTAYEVLSNDSNTDIFNRLRAKEIEWDEPYPPTVLTYGTPSPLGANEDQIGFVYSKLRNYIGVKNPNDPVLAWRESIWTRRIHLPDKWDGKQLKGKEFIIGKKFHKNYRTFLYHTIRKYILDLCNEKLFPDENPIETVELVTEEFTPDHLGSSTRGREGRDPSSDPDSGSESSQDTE